MYKLLYDNVVIKKDSVGYIYKLKQFNTELTNVNSGSVDMVVEILKKINKSAEIYVLPNFLNTTTEIEERYNKIIKKTNSNLTKLQTLLKEETKREIDKSLKFKYDVYLLIKESDDNLTSKKYFKLLDKNSSLSKADKELIDTKNKMFDKLISEINMMSVLGCLKLEVSETINFLEYLHVPEKDFVNDYSVEINQEHLKYVYESDKGEIKKKYARLFQISNLPNKIKDKFYFLEIIRNLTYPVDTIIKLDPCVNNKNLEKEIRQMKNKIKKDQSKYLKTHNDELFEYEQKYLLAEEQLKDVEVNSYTTFNIQVNFRIYANESYKIAGEITSGEDVLNIRYMELKKFFKLDKIDIVAKIGAQEKLMNNITPLTLSDFKNVSIVDEEYFKKFNLLATSTLGNQNLSDAIVKFYSYPNKYPIFVHDYAPITKDINVRATSPVTMYTGSVGSGKSQLANNDIMLNIIMNGSKELVIDPKGDRRGFIKKLKLGEVDSSSIGSEYILGTDLKYKGALDPFINVKSDLSELKTDVVTFIKTLLAKDMKITEFKTNLINEYLDDFFKTEISKNMCNFTDFLKDKNKSYYETLKGFENYSYANLFYSNGHSDVINFDKPLTIVIMDSIANTTNEYDIKKDFFILALEKIEQIAKKFMREQNGSHFGITIEEIGYFKEQTNSTIDLEMSRLIRSFGGILRLVTQNFTDIDEDIITQVGTMLLGSGMDVSQIEVISKNLNMNKSDLSLLNKTNEDESTGDEDKYVFLYVDNNGRKGYVRQRFLNMFDSAFTTKVDG